MSEFSEFLYSLGEISGKAIFIDRTKIEACANKYTFVWKKAVTKSQQKLLDRLAEFVGECETLYGLRITYKKQVKMRQVKKLHFPHIILQVKGCTASHRKDTVNESAAQWTFPLSQVLEG